MGDNTQNIEYDIEIKEELKVDFSELGNQNENVIYEHQNSIIANDTSEKSSHYFKMDPIKVEKDNSYSNSEAILNDQNVKLNHVEIKEENIDDVASQIHDPLELQQQNQQQPQQPQHVELRVNNDKFNGKFCISWLKDNYEWNFGSTIALQGMYKQYLTSLNKFFDKNDVVSLDYFSNCVRCVNCFLFSFVIIKS